LKFSEFAGLDAKMEQLMRSAQAGRIVHALLFSGPRGTGKKTMAGIFARSVLCEGESKPCDACPACKKCLNGSHPDVHYVRRETDRKQIRINQIRELTETMSLGSYEGGKKIAVIEQAELMNPAAQNALLKSLEEPSGDSLYILISEAPDNLLPTIVSRCLQVRFNCLEVQQCAQVLEGRGMDAGRAQQLAAYAQGSVGRALEIDADEDYASLRERVIGALESISAAKDVAAATERIGEVKGREKTVLEIMELWAMDLMRVQNGMRPLDDSKLDKLKKSRYSGSALLKRIILARQQLDANLSWVNVIESMDFALAQKET